VIVRIDLENSLCTRKDKSAVVTKKAGSKKAGKKGRVKTINLKRETIKDLGGREQKRIKGGGGAASSIVMGYRDPGSNL